MKPWIIRVLAKLAATSPGVAAGFPNDAGACSKRHCHQLHCLPRAPPSSCLEGAASSSSCPSQPGRSPVHVYGPAAMC